MDKDIDELLDEVETQFVKTPPPITPISNTRSSEKNIAKPTDSTKKRNTLDALINDILDIDVDESEEIASGYRNNSRTSATDDGSKSEKIRRCFPVFLGGSSNASGIGTNINRRSCDQLRCTACDFKVCFFDNMSWSRDTDYLFLRNNVPEFKKLESKLTKKKGCRAYCCQCSWRNVTDVCELNDLSLKWVCGKHPL
ncbi:hypothetical protein Btru_011741 [Bulinus truncatus]|nr:hypothetical protein Btru_011741 [Bulinus truncatus]